MAEIIPAVEPKYKKISPYDLSSNDNPGAVISQPLLSGSNYDEWAINFRMALSSRKKFGFIDGSIPKPATDSPYLEDWIANNHLIVGWIKLTIDSKIRSSITTREIAKDLWDTIKKRYSLKSGARLQQLRNSLASCKQSGSTVDEYFGRLTKIWDGISECMISKVCSCGKCECDLNGAREQELEILKVHDFLSGLDDSTHGVIRSQICAISPLPDLDSVYQTISQNETLRLTVAADVPVMSFTSQATANQSSSRPYTVHTKELGRTGTNNRDNSKQCTACGRSGHEAAGCFTIIGYPEWWEDRPRRNRGGQNRTNTRVITTNAAPLHANVTITDADRLGLSGITDEQWSIVQKLINKGSTTDRLSGPFDKDADWSG